MERLAAYKILIERLPLAMRCLARIYMVACAMLGHACSTGERAVLALLCTSLAGLALPPKVDLHPM